MIKEVGNGALQDIGQESEVFPGGSALASASTSTNVTNSTIDVSSTCKFVLGNLHHNNRLNRFTLSGQKKVDGRWKLYALIHNT